MNMPCWKKPSSPGFKVISPLEWWQKQKSCSSDRLIDNGGELYKGKVRRGGRTSVDGAYFFPSGCSVWCILHKVIVMCFFLLTNAHDFCSLVSKSSWRRSFLVDQEDLITRQQSTFVPSVVYMSHSNASQNDHVDCDTFPGFHPSPLKGLAFGRKILCETRDTRATPVKTRRQTKRKSDDPSVNASLAYYHHGTIITTGCEYGVWVRRQGERQ